MRRYFAGCVTLLVLVSAAVAAPPRHVFKLARADTGFAQFRHDQRECESLSTRINWNGAHPESAIHMQRSEREFLKCMGFRGYKLDANGHSTGSLWRTANR